MSPFIPPCCFEEPAQGTGGLVLGGTAAAKETLPAIAADGLVLGGTAAAKETLSAIAAGGLVLGGTAAAKETLSAIAAGGLVLGGTAAAKETLSAIAAGGLVLGGTASPHSVIGSGSGSGSGGAPREPCAFCSGGKAAAQFTFTLSGITNGTCTDCAHLLAPVVLSYVSACQYESPQIVICLIDHYPWFLTISSATVLLFFSTSGVQYSATLAGWDCVSPKTVSRVSTSTICNGWPATITLSPL